MRGESKMFKDLLRLATLSFALTAVAQELPPSSNDDTAAYDVTKLIARANQNDGYSLPAGSILGIADVKLNNRGDVAFDVDVLGGSENAAVWFVPNGATGSAVYRAQVNGRLITDPGLNNKGDLVFGQFDFGVTDGVMK